MSDANRECRTTRRKPFQRLSAHSGCGNAPAVGVGKDELGCGHRLAPGEQFQQVAGHGQGVVLVVLRVAQGEGLPGRVHVFPGQLKGLPSSSWYSAAAKLNKARK